MAQVYDRSPSYLVKILSIFILLWIVIQFIVVLNVKDLPLTSDSLRYLACAEEGLSQSKIYPTLSQVELTENSVSHPNYICYPGLINLIELCIVIFGTYKAIFYVNILLNCITLASLWYIGKKLVGLRFALISACLYCLYPLPVMMVGTCMSEIPCVAFTYLSIALLCKYRYGWIIMSGVLMVIAAYIRTVSLIFCIASLLFMLYKKYEWKRIGTYVISGSLAYCGILFVNYANTGYCFFSSSTLGINMIVGVNEKCEGTYPLDVELTPQEVDRATEGKNVFQIDSIYKKYALNTIKNQFGRWAFLAPLKIKYQFTPDNYLHFGRPGIKVINTCNKWSKSFVFVWKSYCWLYQIGLVISFLWGVWLRRRSLWGTDGIILLPLIGGIFLAVLTVGAPRYNMPYIPVLIYFAAWSMYGLKNKSLKSKIFREFEMRKCNKKEG